MAQCMRCGRELTADEIGLHKKLVNRASTSFLCLSCLSHDVGCDEPLLLRKIEQFRDMGCTLFAPRTK